MEEKASKDDCGKRKLKTYSKNCSNFTKEPAYINTPSLKDLN